MKNTRGTILRAIFGHERAIPASWAKGRHPVLVALPVVLALMVLGAYRGVSAAELDKSEQAIVAAVHARIPEAVALLEKTVNVNSGTMNHEGVREVGRIFREEFNGLGFQTRWIDMPPEVKRAGHLVASREGTHGKRLLLLGHLDTVFEKDSSFQKWTRSGDKANGPGVMDMKGGLVVVVEALRALRGVGALEDATVFVVFTGDEERPGEPLSASRGDLVAIAKHCDVALSFEPLIAKSGGIDTATTARRGLTFWTLTASGNQGHAATIFSPETGFGAVFEAARILDSFRGGLIEPDLTFNPGLIMGGTAIEYDPAASRGAVQGKNNVVAQTLRVEGDLRFLSDAQRDRAKERMIEIVKDSLPGTSAEIAFQDTYPAFALTDGNRRLLNELSKISVDAGYNSVEATEPGARGAADISFVAPYVDGLDGLGIEGTGAHSLNEEADLRSIERATVRAALLIHRLTRKASE